MAQGAIQESWSGFQAHPLRLIGGWGDHFDGTGLAFFRQIRPPPSMGKEAIAGQVMCQERPADVQQGAHLTE